MFFAILLAAGVLVGPPDRRLEMPATPPRCINGVNGDCNTPFWAAPPQPRAPVRDCPEGTTLRTVRPGVRYCIPDRIIGQ